MYTVLYSMKNNGELRCKGFPVYEEAEDFIRDLTLEPVTNSRILTDVIEETDESEESIYKKMYLQLYADFVKPIANNSDAEIGSTE